MINDNGSLKPFIKMNVFNDNHLLKEADHQFKRDQADGKRQDNPFSYGYETK